MGNKVWHSLHCLPNRPSAFPREFYTAAPRPADPCPASDPLSLTEWHLHGALTQSFAPVQFHNGYLQQQPFCFLLHSISSILVGVNCSSKETCNPGAHHVLHVPWSCSLPRQCYSEHAQLHCWALCPMLGSESRC